VDLWYGMLLVSFLSCQMSVFFFGMRALTSLPLELQFGWGGEWGLLRCRRAPGGAACHLIASL
jgi:hypothetical protein